MSPDTHTQDVSALLSGPAASPPRRGRLDTLSLDASTGLVLSVLLWAKQGRKERKEEPYPEGSQWETKEAVVGLGDCG